MSDIKIIFTSRLYPIGKLVMVKNERWYIIEQNDIPNHEDKYRTTIKRG